MDFVQSENLQNLIDQWGDTDIEELEAFIDSYFQMVWQETMNEPKCSSMTPVNSEGSGITENDQDIWPQFTGNCQCLTSWREYKETCGS